MSLEIYQAIVDTASAVGSLVAVCLAYKAFDVSRNISDHEHESKVRRQKKRTPRKPQEHPRF